MDGRFYYVMEYLNGEDLGALVKREGKLPPERAVELIAQAARGLHEAHRAGILHRDVKPENLFLAGNRVKVLDFGLAAYAQSEELSATGFMGTPAFASPERVREERGDVRSDIYSLGAVLYLLVCGRPVFRAKAPADVLRKHLEAVPAPPASLTAVPPWLDAAILRCLEKRPEDRYGDMAAFLEVISTPPLN